MGRNYAFHAVCEIFSCRCHVWTSLRLLLDLLRRLLPSLLRHHGLAELLFTGWFIPFMRPIECDFPWVLAGGRSCGTTSLVLGHMLTKSMYRLKAELFALSRLIVFGNVEALCDDRSFGLRGGLPFRRWFPQYAWWVRLSPLPSY